MIRSMTGYGKGETKRDNYQVIVEIKTVNHRYSNIYLHMPGHLLALESTLHKIIREKVSRGRVDLYLKIEEDITTGAYLPEINEEMATIYYNKLNILKDKLKLNQELSLATLVSLPEVLSLKEVNDDEKVLHQIIIDTVKKSLDSLISMRIHEGEELYNDFLSRLEKIESSLLKITEREPQVVEEYKSRMRQRINELLQDTVIEEDRLALEVAILAEKCSINEEIVRLKSHIGQFRMNLEKSEPVGRKLDFIAQEMYRETNTIGSKSIDAIISSDVVNIKSEIDKIREQIQNIE